MIIDDSKNSTRQIRLPDEIIEHEIFPKILPQSGKPIKSGLENVLQVSKVWNKYAAKVKKDWVNQKFISLRTYGCKTALEAIQKIIDYQLYIAALEDFPDITDEEVTYLIMHCPLLKHLSLSSDQLKDFPLENLVMLESLNLNGCSGIPQVRLENMILGSKNLKYLSFAGCNTTYKVTCYWDLR